MFTLVGLETSFHFALRFKVMV